MSENVAVLLVDDRLENLVALEAVLENLEVDLVRARSGNDALRLSLRQDFALVLLDVQMPGMSGFETAELMRANPKTRHLPIIFVTAGMNDAQLQFEGYTLGAVDYLIKPFEPHILKSKVKVFCELYNQRKKLELTHHEQLFNTMREGYAHCRMYYENGHPRDYSYIKVNTAFEQLTGVKNVEGRNVSEVIPSLRESSPDLFETFGRVAATGNPELFETHVERLDRWFSISVYSTEKEHFVSVFQDISERKHLERLLTDKNVELEHAKAVAEKANLAKSDFISSMSHELRTPLNAILGFAQLLERSLQPPTGIQQSRLQQILKAGWYLLELINEILDLAVIESGKLSLSRKPLPLAEVLLECRAMIETQAQDRDIKLTFPKFDFPCFAYADRIRLKQVLINLLSNAIKYNREHGTVEVTCSVNTHGRIRIGIKDSGVGLPPEKLEHLFQPFNRLGQEDGAEEGTGLGLVVSKRLVELMGGEIGVESVVGVGSEFWIELIQADMPQLATEIRLPAALSPKAHGNSGQHILLYVEDNPANLMLVEQIIEDHPHLKLLSARDGNHGVAQARAHQPDVILMDINLPGISGIEAMHILRKDPTTKHIPIIALSANAMPRDIEKGLEAGFFRYLTKPIKIDELENALEMALKPPAEDEARSEYMKQRA